MSSPIKHLIKCRCFLPQFRNQSDPPNHQFVVFGVLDDEDKLIPKFVQCNNCGIVHKVTDLCRSEIMNGRENLNSIISLDELKTSLSEQIVTILETHSVDQATWEQVSWIIENSRWGDFVVLSSDTIDGSKQGKILKVLGSNMFKIDSFIRDELVG